MTAFAELMQLYKWSLAATVIIAGTLSLIGAQWTAREKSSQIFVLGQGTSLGITLGLALNIIFDIHSHGLGLALGLTLGWLTLALSDVIIKVKSDRNHIYLTLFVLFMSVSYLITSLVPALETHIASSYFGDISVMSDFAAIAGLIFGVVFTFFLLMYWKEITLSSFQIVNQSAIHKDYKNWIFDLGTLLLTTLAIQNMGYLFSMGSLFIGTTFAAHKSASLASYTKKIIFISQLGSLIGFMVSLLSTNLPTVPCILVGQMLVGFVSYVKK